MFGGLLFDGANSAMISTRDLSGLPEVGRLRRLMRSQAMLDAILCPEWESRHFSFDSKWARGQQMGSMRNAQGDHYFTLFNVSGCWLKGFDHGAPMSPFSANPPMVSPGVLDGAPAEFADCLSEPAFVIAETTFCIWRRYSDSNWQHGAVAFPPGINDPDGSAHLLRWLDGLPNTYRQWAQDYYECEVSAEAVESIFGHRPLNQDIVTELNRDLELSQLHEDVEQIGYPE